MKPTVGRIVHYTNLGDRDGKYPPEVQAAIITKVHGSHDVSLCVLYPTGFFFMEHAMLTDASPGTDGARGRWAWPQRS